MATIQFKGKEIVRNYHLSVPYHELTPNEKKSFTKKISLNDNLIIHGDNLLALKALLPTYAGEVKCIYIDPPYNTGNEKWTYNDKVNSPMMKEWLDKVVDKDDLTRHDKWLCMMMPRLKLLRELLMEDGIIFISIDENEFHHLKMLLDDVFEEDNFLTYLTWRQMHTVRSSSKDFNRNTEFIIVYARDKKKLIIEGKSETYLRYPADKEEAYGYDDNDGRGPYKLDPLHSRNYYTPYKYIFRNKHEWEAPKGTYPRYSKEKLREFEAERRVVLSGDQLRKKEGIMTTYTGRNPVAKRYLREVQEGVPPDALLPVEEVGFSKDGTAEMMEIFGDKVFDQPKPYSLIKFLLRIHRKVDGKDYIVLDSFAGTGTTAHAVMALNKEDGGNRKYILVQLPEEIEKDKPAYKLGFRDVVDITAERLRRVIKGVKNAKDENLKKGFGGTFSYYELGKPIDAERVLKGKNVPSFIEMARYIFYTATGEEFIEKKVNEKTGFIGESKEYQVYLFYEPDLEYLKNTALTLERAEKIGRFSGKKRLIFAPAKYLDQEHLERLKIDFAQLPFEIYQKQ